MKIDCVRSSNLHCLSFGLPEAASRSFEARNRALRSTYTSQSPVRATRGLHFCSIFAMWSFPVTERPRSNLSRLQLMFSPLLAVVTLLSLPRATTAQCGRYSPTPAQECLTGTATQRDANSKDGFRQESPTVCCSFVTGGSSDGSNSSTRVTVSWALFLSRALPGNTEWRFEVALDRNVASLSDVTGARLDAITNGGKTLVFGGRTAATAGESEQTANENEIRLSYEIQGSPGSETPQPTGVELFRKVTTIETASGNSESREHGSSSNSKKRNTDAYTVGVVVFSGVTLFLMGTLVLAHQHWCPCPAHPKHQAQRRESIRSRERADSKRSLRRGNSGGVRPMQAQSCASSITVKEHVKEMTSHQAPDVEMV